jgi:hypothetical protein
MAAFIYDPLVAVGVAVNAPTTNEVLSTRS